MGLVGAYAVRATSFKPTTTQFAIVKLEDPEANQIKKTELEILLL